MSTHDDSPPSNTVADILRRVHRGDTLLVSGSGYVWTDRQNNQPHVPANTAGVRMATFGGWLQTTSATPEVRLTPRARAWLDAGGAR